MTLAEWMALRGVRDDELAARIKVSRPTVSRIRRGLVRPSWKTIEKIKTATGYAVTANDFMPQSEAAQ